MTPIEQRKSAESFVKFWKKKIQEKTENQITSQFWENLLQQVYGVQYTRDFIDFEMRVRVLGEPKPKRIDGYIASTKVLIEQKGFSINLDDKIEQSGGIKLTPYEQAKRYADNLPNNRRPNWIVVSNFREFRIHDLNSERPDKYQSVYFDDLSKEYHRLSFLQNISSTNVYKEVDVSRKAGHLIGEIYSELQKQYERLDEKAMHELNVLCVRLVFCLYAEDAGIFRKNQFGDYLRNFSPGEIQYKLHDLFIALSTTNRDNLFIDSKAKEFEYVNGGLFQDTSIGIPPITEEVKQLLVAKSSDGFNWEDISPTIFGGIFESTLNPEARREGGMHYTSVENIHKVIDPLFLNELTEELDDIIRTASVKLRKRKLKDYQDKLASITFLDPACGSGNFLTETYLSLRRLENRAIREYYRDMTPLMGGMLNPICVNIEQFYGIEINDFAVSVAKTAMWIAEYQMRLETLNIVAFDDSFLPLKSYAKICKGNALRMDWNKVISTKNLSYIMGNPPFLGYKLQTHEQKADLASVLADETEKSLERKIDYVAGWYTKSVQMMQKNPKIRAALVSTNSITQGEQVAIMWKPLVERYGLQIDFAHRTFVWDGEANVYCVIVGFSCSEEEHTKYIFDGEEKIVAQHINAYLVDEADVWIDTNKKQISGAPKMCKGSQPTGKFDATEEEIALIKEKHPELLPYVRRFIGADEYLYGIPRYCYWLKDAPQQVIRKCPMLVKRLDAIRKQRLESTKAATRKWAERPMEFTENRQPNTDYLLVPRHTSENREYIPIGFMSKDVICGDANLLVADATLYHFGIMTSNTHMAWMRMVCGRLEMRYRYSNDIVYNNFPWIEATDEQKNKITELAQHILDIRKSQEEKGNCLADMYDPKFMPSDLRKAHCALDRAVLKLYGLKPDTDEMDIVKHLLRLYKDLKPKRTKKNKK